MTGNFDGGVSMGRRCAMLVLVASLLGTVGCATKSDLNLAPAKGKVTYNGTPVSGATVIFQPADGSNMAVGTTDPQGAFTLMTGGEPGVVIGSCNVSVSKQEGAPTGVAVPQPDPVEGEAPNTDPASTATFAPGTEEKSAEIAAEKGPANELPIRYANPGTSGLTVTVTETGPNDFNIELTD